VLDVRWTDLFQTDFSERLFGYSVFVRQGGMELCGAVQQKMKV
jgi:hypothetical protein